MNILYLAHRIPYPPNKGDKLRAFRHLAHLSTRHRVWCACFVDTPEDQQYARPLAAYCEQLAAIPLHRGKAAVRGLLGLARGETVTESYYRHADMTETLSQWCSAVDFDVVVAFSSGMAPYALSTQASRRVLDLCELDSRKWLDYATDDGRPVSMLYRTEGRRLAARENKWLHSFNATILISEFEAASLSCDVAGARVHVVTNGVDLPDRSLDAHPPWRIGNPCPPRPPDDPGESTGLASPLKYDNAEAESAQPDQDGTRGFHSDGMNTARCPTIGFVGVMDYRPNADAVCSFVEECWREIRRAVPDAMFRIVGRNPVRRVRRLASVGGVQVVGAVEDMAAELRGFDVSVAPIRIAHGLQNKILEAMAASLPVITTPMAARGIGARANEHYLVADTPDKMIRYVIRLMRDPAKRRRIGVAARRFVVVHHCWADALRRFELVVTGVLERSVRDDSIRLKRTPRTDGVGQTTP